VRRSVPLLVAVGAEREHNCLEVRAQEAAVEKEAWTSSTVRRTASRLYSLSLDLD